MLLNGTKVDDTKILDRYVFYNKIVIFLLPMVTLLYLNALLGNIFLISPCVYKREKDSAKQLTHFDGHFVCRKTVKQRKLYSHLDISGHEMKQQKLKNNLNWIYTANILSA